jgi:hypothetical protein
MSPRDERILKGFSVLFYHILKKDKNLEVLAILQTGRAVLRRCLHYLTSVSTKSKESVGKSPKIPSTEHHDFMHVIPVLFSKCLDFYSRFRP